VIVVPYSDDENVHSFWIAKFFYLTCLEDQIHPL
jgi:hypothetical protein